MPKPKSKFTCRECGYESPKWVGKCPKCQAWNSFQEEIKKKQGGQSSAPGQTGTNAVPIAIADIKEEHYIRYRSGLTELDKVFGGGITKGSLTLLGGEPGIGKSTLLMEITGRIAKAYPKEKILYVSGEESAAQVASRGRRLGLECQNYFILNETCWQATQESIKKIKPKFFVLDSIQTISNPDVQAAAGATTQIRDVTYEIMNYAKATGTTCFVIGHVTKDGAIAGPKVLEHMVDTVVYFEGDQHGDHRLLRAMKNRFGNTNEICIFDMREKGLEEVVNPSEYFLEADDQNRYGRSITCVLEGSRPIFVEVQSLVVENRLGSGRRTTQGVEANKLSLLVAVIDKYFGVPLSYNDIYLNVVGGLKVNSRESDLAVLASLLSSYFGIPIESSTVFIGEVGLTGEVRTPATLEARLKEMEKLSYKRVVTSAKAAEDLKDKFKINLIGLKRASDLKELLF